MNSDDTIYLSLLSFSIIFGHFYRRIRDKTRKKLIGTLIGLSVVVIVSGVHIIHCFISILGCSYIIFKKRTKRHLYTFIFSFGYLLFFRTVSAPKHTNLIQMMLTLKMVGLALEVEKEDLQLNFRDVCHYAFNYIGVLSGPYYKYQTFHDYFEYDFGVFARYKRRVFNILAVALIFVVLFLGISENFPPTFMLCDEFYNARTAVYRYFYVFPIYVLIKLRLYTGIYLSECSCIIAGFGAYPEFTKPHSGWGPTEKLEQMKNLRENFEKAQYNFESVNACNFAKVEMSPYTRQTVRNWNKCVQFWMEQNIYKRLPFKDKIYKLLVTFLLSCVWHGMHPGYYVFACCSIFSMIFEELFYGLFMLRNENHKKSKISRKAHLVNLVIRNHLMAHQCVIFTLLEFDKILRYSSSIRHLGFILHLILFVVTLLLTKCKTNNRKKL